MLHHRQSYEFGFSLAQRLTTLFLMMLIFTLRFKELLFKSFHSTLSIYYCCLFCWFCFFNGFSVTCLVYMHAYNTYLVSAGRTTCYHQSESLWCCCWSATVLASHWLTATSRYILEGLKLRLSRKESPAWRELACDAGLQVVSDLPSVIGLPGTMVEPNV